MEKLREQINEIDDKLRPLFIERMKVSGAIGAYKREHGLPVFDHSRELAVLKRLKEGVDPEFSEYVETLYNTIFEISRDYQSRLTKRENL